MPYDLVSSHLVLKRFQPEPICVRAAPNHTRDAAAAFSLTPETKGIINQHGSARS
jgi:hypothetical protein